MKAKIAVIAVVVLMSLTGCSDTTVQEESKTGSLGASSFYQDLPDGTKVACVRLYSEAVTCDWGHKVVDIGEGK